LPVVNGPKLEEDGRGVLEMGGAVVMVLLLDVAADPAGIGARATVRQPVGPLVKTNWMVLVDSNKQKLAAPLVNASLVHARGPTAEKVVVMVPPARGANASNGTPAFVVYWPSPLKS